MPKTIVAVGEALWDVFPDGRRPGGAPCNVAFHAAQLGNRGVIVTRVGRDDDGDELIEYLDGRGVETGFIQRDTTRSTGTVVVKFSHSNPSYDITDDVAWDYIAAADAARALVAEADAVCVGSLAQRSATSRDAIRQLMTDAHDNALVVYDVNLRPPFVDPEVVLASLRAADVVKLNEAEVDQLSMMLDRPSLIHWLVNSVGVRAVCVTRGEDGATIATAEETVSAPGVTIDTSRGDPVGAGDAFTAAMTHELVRHGSPAEVLRTANRYAALVASKQGAMPEITTQDRARIGL